MQYTQYENHLPLGDLCIICMENCIDMGRKINKHIKEMRSGQLGVPDTFLLRKQEIRFANGEGKIFLKETVRGKDVYILTDIGNYSMTYTLYGYENRKSPDDHIQDLKRVLSAMAGKARRITILMPLLYASRQHSRKGRESLDCSMALQELEKLGVDDIITFDAHDPTIQNAIPLISFENVYPTFDIVKCMIENEPEIAEGDGNTLIVSPDTGAMDRAVYYSSVLGFDIGLFYKRRDHSRVVKGKNPIVQHEYIGRDVKGMNILIVDDMIASGESVLDIARELKQREANKIFIATSFALFTEGTAKFDDYYERGLFDKVYSTNLTHVPENTKSQPWFAEVDLSYYMARIVNRLNYDVSISEILDANRGIKDLVSSRKARLE